jgi:hypothetical protein
MVVNGMQIKANSHSEYVKQGGYSSNIDNFLNPFD